MIDPKELRLGNFILDDFGNIAKVCALGRIIECTRENIIWQTVFKPEPIPLTEDWLRKMGFKGMPEDSGAWYLNPVLFDMGGIGSMSSDFELSGSSGDYRYSRNVPTVKYVHQLQNLYFALCGQELTLKEV
jgi:hypothetical protein